MASTIKVNNIQNQCGANIGRTGTVDWDTTKKTTSFTTVSGTGYFVDTSGGAITATLPATPSAGDIVAFNDYARTFGTNSLTVDRNGSNIQGATFNGSISTSGQSIMFVYVDATQGWIPTEDSNTGNYGADFITATGGTITTCGNYKIHTFTGPGTFCVSNVGNPAGSISVDYLVVAGGGGAAGIGINNSGMAGGGAGGYRESGGTASGCYTVSPLGACVSALPVSVTSYPITVGAGGSGGAIGLGNMGSNGNPSIFSTITSAGGGRGGGYNGSWISGCAGGSGGGGTFCFSGSAGNTPPVSPPQGNAGGDGISPPGACGSAGGGGATSAGNNAVNPNTGGTGGNGAGTAINPAQGTPGPNGALKYFAGGGGGAPFQVPGTICGGYGGGGPSAAAAGPGVNGTTNTGGGAGGTSSSPSCSYAGASGGSGIVIIRYKYQ
jgi:hypothetical protein